MIELHKKFGFRPRAAVWEITLRCNMRCQHCGSRAGKKRRDELTLAEALKLCEDLAAMGCRRLTLSGEIRCCVRIGPSLRRSSSAVA